MNVANPIYDSVFKFLMEDYEVARLLLSSIIGSEIISLEPRPHEYTKTKVNSGASGGTDITVCRIDFSAKIQTPEGPKLILIELQKATDMYDVIRFRDYLGRQLSNPENTGIITVKNKTGKGKDKEKKIQLPVYCLYILGRNAGIGKAPVVRVDPNVYDVATGELITGRNMFIDTLHHHSWIIQASYLKEPYRTDLERLLSVFDQSKCTSDIHVMNIREEDFPEKYRPFIRRLKIASSKPKIREEMKKEDLFIRYIRECIRAGTEELFDEIEDLNDTIAENKAALAEKDNALAEKDNALAENKAALEQKEKELIKMKEILMNAGINLID